MQICDPQPSDIHFDLNQFGGKRQRAVSKETGITFNDYDRMHIKRRGQRPAHRDPAPIWAMNDELLREVICRYLERRNYLSDAPDKPYEQRLAVVRAAAAKRIPWYRADLNSLIDHKVSAVEIQNMDTKIIVEQRGMPELVAAIVYLYYRLGWNSVQIAEELGCVKPPHVRIILYRLRVIWKDIETGRKFRSRRFSRMEGPLLHSPGKVWTQERLKQLWLLRAAGKTFREIGKVFDGRTAIAVYAAFSYYFPKARTLPQAGRKYVSVQRDKNDGVRIRMGVRS